MIRCGCAFIAGVLATLAVPYWIPSIGEIVSQRMYDCGIRISADVDMKIVSLFMPDTHRWMICNDRASKASHRRLGRQPPSADEPEGEDI